MTTTTATTTTQKPQSDTHTGAAAPPLLHAFSGSPYVWRVKIALAEKGVAHETRYYRRDQGEHRTPELTVLNPRVQLPVLQWGEVTLYESLAICHFLEAERPAPPLIPAGRAERARTLVLSQEAAHLDAGSLDAFFHAMGALKGEDARLRAYRELHAELGRWEAHMEAGGDYLVGDEFTLADLAVFPFVAFGVRFQLDLGRRTPRLADWYARLAERPSVQAGWPPHWHKRGGVDAGFNEID